MLLDACRDLQVDQEKRQLDSYQSFLFSNQNLTLTVNQSTEN